MVVFFKDLFIYDRHRERGRERERERGRDTGGGRSRLHAGSPTQDSIPGLQDSRIAPWAEGRRQTTEPSRDPQKGRFLQKGEWGDELLAKGLFPAKLLFLRGAGRGS